MEVTKIRYENETYDIQDSDAVHRGDSLEINGVVTFKKGFYLDGELISINGDEITFGGDS